ncbi:unnamed protein product, partial [Brenthis ino]
MFSFKSIVLIAAAFAIEAECSASVAAALIAPAHVGYAHAVPQNIPPYASQVNVETRSALVAAPPVAAYTAPLAAPFTARFAPVPAAYSAASYIASAPVLPAAYAASTYAVPAPFAPHAAYAAAYPYAASYPLLRAPYGVAPAFVR